MGIEHIFEDRIHTHRQRFLVIGIGGILVVAGIVMTFMGLTGAIDLELAVDSKFTANLTNASPGIVFSLLGVLLCWVGIYSRHRINYENDAEAMDAECFLED